MDSYVEPYCQDCEKNVLAAGAHCAGAGEGFDCKAQQIKDEETVSGLRLRFPLGSGSEVALQVGKSWASMFEAARGTESHFPGELPALPCTPNLLSGTHQVDLSISKVNLQGQFVTMGSIHGGTHGSLAVLLMVVLHAPQSP